MTVVLFNPLGENKGELTHNDPVIADRICRKGWCLRIPNWFDRTCLQLLSYYDPQIHDVVEAPDGLVIWCNGRQ